MRSGLAFFVIIREQLWAFNNIPIGHEVLVQTVQLLVSYAL